MLQDMDNMEASRGLYFKVGIFNQLEQSKVSVLTGTKIGIVRLPVQHDMIFALSFIQDPWEY